MKTELIEEGVIPSFKFISETKFVPNPKTGLLYTEEEYRNANFGTSINVIDELKKPWRPK